MVRHRLGTLLGLSFALLLPLVACGEDNDILREDTTTTPPAQDPQTQDPDPDLTDPNQLNSGDVCEVSACGTPASGTACCTTADDVTAIRAVEADKCGVDMSSFGFPGCTQKDQPGTLDAACPPVEFPPGAPPMQGCCTPAGHCGAMETFMGFGCTSNPDPSTWIPCGS